jgi:hypothetical protein
VISVDSAQESAGRVVRRVTVVQGREVSVSGIITTFEPGRAAAGNRRDRPTNSIRMRLAVIDATIPQPVGNSMSRAAILEDRR